MDTTEKEKTKDEINRLYRLYYERKEEFDSAQMRRMILTIIGFAIFYFAVFYIIGKPNGFKNLFGLLIVSIAMSGFHCFINGGIFSALTNKSVEENESLINIKKRISELEKEL